ncbi:NAD-dependent epimerase/dehydratase family protein [Streptosporangium sp. NPDC001559]|uniref:NAD-dependent epimerase/dehydratase family protein n=1 Tax=Streptosporangium sp. NPDC001559 TaxID=3366187 RepID=UPI0036EED2BF
MRPLAHLTTSTTAVSKPVNLSGAVMAHPKRAEAARQLADFDARGRINVVLDPVPDGPPTALRTANLAWECVGEDATHHLVLQDDVVLSEGFFEYAERVASAVPDEAVAFYAGWEGRNGAVVRLAALTGAQWAYAIEEHVPCLALMLPARVARGYTRFAAEHGNGWPYDVVMQRFLNSCKVRVRLAVPSTVDHSDVPSVAGNVGHGWRHATLFTPQAVEPTTYECREFPVVPFYQHGYARCAVRHGAQWEIIETERHLQRIGLLEECRRAFAGTGPSPLPDHVAQAVWVTGFAVGAVVAELATETPEPSVTTTVMEALGPGGLCKEVMTDELVEMVVPARELALTALEEGRGTQSSHRRPAAEPATVAQVAVTGGESGFGPQLARLLGDGGYHADHLPAPVDTRQLSGVSYVVHLGRPSAGPGLLAGVLSAAAEAGVKRLLYVGSAEVYRGSGDRTVTEESVSEPPADPVALEWWREEEECRQWGERNGIAVQVLRLAEPVGPNAPTDGALARSMLLAWTRRPLKLDPLERHQILEHRDMADAIGTVLAASQRPSVLNVASAAYTGEELAELVTEFTRRTPLERLSESGGQRWVMATDVIATELNWRPSASLPESLRALAQWLSCDTHTDLQWDGLR